MGSEAARTWYHEDFDRFRNALSFTESLTGFSARLIEKDYYCTLILEEFATRFESALVFKGGTCLSKVHAEFFRLSEDLDFCVATPADATRSERRQAAIAIRDRFADIPRRIARLAVVSPFTGSNNSRQYHGRLAYSSMVTGESGTISIEVSFREPIILPTELLPARSLLCDAQTTELVLGPLNVYALSGIEAYAEKIRAALTRREPAIRDYFDIDHALRKGLLDHRDPIFLPLVAKKLSAATNDPIDLSESKLKKLQNQLVTQLRPVLRHEDYHLFALESVFAVLREIMESYQQSK